MRVVIFKEQGEPGVYDRPVLLWLASKDTDYDRLVWFTPDGDGFIAYDRDEEPQAFDGLLRQHKMGPRKPGVTLLGDYRTGVAYQGLSNMVLIERDGHMISVYRIDEDGDYLGKNNNDPGFEKFAGLLAG